MAVRFPADHYVASLPSGSRASAVRRLVDQALSVEELQRRLEEVDRKLDVILSVLQNSGAVAAEKPSPSVNIDPDDFLNFL